LRAISSSTSFILHPIRGDSPAIRLGPGDCREYRPGQLDALPPAIHHGYVLAFSDSLHAVFLIDAPVALLAFALTWLLKTSPCGATPTQARELGLLGLGPAGQKAGEPGPAGGQEPADRRAALRSELQPGRPPVLRVPGLGDQARPLELLGLARHRRSVDAQLLGQVSQPQARPARVQHIQHSKARPIHIDTRLGKQELMQPDLLQRARQRVQRRFDLADRFVVHRLGCAER